MRFFTLLVAALALQIALAVEPETCPKAVSPICRASFSLGAVAGPHGQGPAITSYSTMTATDKHGPLITAIWDAPFADMNGTTWADERPVTQFKPWIHIREINPLNYGPDSGCDDGVMLGHVHDNSDNPEYVKLMNKLTVIPEGGDEFDQHVIASPRTLCHALGDGADCNDLSQDNTPNVALQTAFIPMADFIMYVNHTDPNLTLIDFYALRRRYDLQPSCSLMWHDRSECPNLRPQNFADLNEATAYTSIIMQHDFWPVGSRLDYYRDGLPETYGAMRYTSKAPEKLFYVRDNTVFMFYHGSSLHQNQVSSGGIHFEVIHFQDPEQDYYPEMQFSYLTQSKLPLPVFGALFGKNQMMDYSAKHVSVYPCGRFCVAVSISGIRTPNSERNVPFHNDADEQYLRVLEARLEWSEIPRRVVVKDVHYFFDTMVDFDPAHRHLVDEGLGRRTAMSPGWYCTLHTRRCYATPDTPYLMSVDPYLPNEFLEPAVLGTVPNSNPLYATRTNLHVTADLWFDIPDYAWGMNGLLATHNSAPMFTVDRTRVYFYGVCNHILQNATSSEYTAAPETVGRADGTWYNTQYLTGRMPGREDQMRPLTELPNMHTYTEENGAYNVPLPGVADPSDLTGLGLGIPGFDELMRGGSFYPADDPTAPTAPVVPMCFYMAHIRADPSPKFLPRYAENPINQAESTNLYDYVGKPCIPNQVTTNCSNQTYTEWYVQDDCRPNPEISCGMMPPVTESYFAEGVAPAEYSTPISSSLDETRSLNGLTPSIVSTNAVSTDVHFATEAAQTRTEDDLSVPVVSYTIDHSTDSPANHVRRARWSKSVSKVLARFRGWQSDPELADLAFDELIARVNEEIDNLPDAPASPALSTKYERTGLPPVAGERSFHELMLNRARAVVVRHQADELDAVHQAAAQRRRAATPAMLAEIDAAEAEAEADVHTRYAQMAERSIKDPRSVLLQLGEHALPASYDPSSPDVEVAVHLFDPKKVRAEFNKRLARRAAAARVSNDPKTVAARKVEAAVGAATVDALWENIVRGKRDRPLLTAAEIQKHNLKQADQDHVDRVRRVSEGRARSGNEIAQRAVKRAAADVVSVSPNTLHPRANLPYEDYIRLPQASTQAGAKAEAKNQRTARTAKAAARMDAPVFGPAEPTAETLLTPEQDAHLDQLGAVDRDLRFEAYLDLFDREVADDELDLDVLASVKLHDKPLQPTNGLRTAPKFAELKAAYEAEMAERAKAAPTKMRALPRDTGFNLDVEVEAESTDEPIDVTAAALAARTAAVESFDADPEPLAMPAALNEEHPFASGNKFVVDDADFEASLDIHSKYQFPAPISFHDTALRLYFDPKFNKYTASGDMHPPRWTGPWSLHSYMVMLRARAHTDAAANIHPIDPYGGTNDFTSLHFNGTIPTCPDGYVPSYLCSPDRVACLPQAVIANGNLVCEAREPPTFRFTNMNLQDYMHAVGQLPESTDLMTGASMEIVTTPQATKPFVDTGL